MENKQVNDRTDDILRFLLSKDEEFRKTFLRQVENDPELREETLITAAYLKAVNSGKLTGENYDSQDIRRYLLDEDTGFDKTFLEILKSDSCMRREVAEHVKRYKKRMEQKEEQMYQYCFPGIYEAEKQVQAQIEKKRKIYQIGMRVLPIAACILLAIGFFVVPRHYTQPAATELLLVNLPDTSVTNLLTDHEMSLVSKICDDKELDELTGRLESEIHSHICLPDEVSGRRQVDEKELIERTKNADIMRYYLAVFYLKTNKKELAVEALREILDGDKQTPIYPFAESLFKSIDTQ